jgi:hypothetical protein
LCIDELAVKIAGQSMSANLLEMIRQAEEKFFYANQTQMLEERIAALPIGLCVPL